MNTHKTYKYNRLSRVLHWTSAIIIVGLFALGLWMIKLDYEHEWYEISFHYHESIGILTAVLIAFRLLWKLITPQPKFCSKSDFEKRAAILAHASMYILCIVIFVSGYLIPTADGRSIAVFDWFFVPSLGSFHHLQADIAGTIHFWLAITLIALVVLHTMAACKHHFIDKDNILKKML